MEMSSAKKETEKDIQAKVYQITLLFLVQGN